MSLLAFIIGFAGSNSCAYIKNMPCWKMEGWFLLFFFPFLSPYICCLSFWRKLELCLIILLYYRGKNNSVPGNAAMPNSIPFRWFSQSLRFDQILLIARDQSMLNMKITWKSVLGFFQKEVSQHLLSKSFISTLGYIPPLMYFRPTGYVQGWILMHSSSACCSFPLLQYTTLTKSDCLISFILSTKVYWEEWFNTFFTFILSMTFSTPSRNKVYNQ